MVLKEQTGGKVAVFTMGPTDAEKALRDAMALGCDESCLITDRCLAGGDTIATAKVLARSIEKYGKFDLILSGALSADGATGQVGAWWRNTWASHMWLKYRDSHMMRMTRTVSRL